MRGAILLSAPMVNTQKKNAEPSLEQLRKDIDAVDTKLLELFRERMALVHQVGELKASEQVKCVIRPGREASMVRKLIKAAADIFPARIVYTLWRGIIAASTLKEAPLSYAVHLPENNTTPYWLAREYFSVETPHTAHTNPMHVLMEVLGGKSTVGVLPLMNPATGRPWWVEMLEMADRLSIFAALPFIGAAPFGGEKVIALGPVTPEETGEDTTLVVVSDAKSISRESVHHHFGKHGVKLQEVLKYEEGFGNKSVRYQLFALEGFFVQGSEVIAAVTESLNAVNATDMRVGITVLGAYATPLSKE